MRLNTENRMALSQPACIQRMANTCWWKLLMMGSGLKRNISYEFLKDFTVQPPPGAEIREARGLAWPSVNILLKPTDKLSTCAAHPMLERVSDLRSRRGK